MDYELPEELLYTEDHEWYDVDSGWIGITDYAQSQLGDVVYVDLPDNGQSVEAGRSFMVVESVKSVSDIYGPVSGTVVEINQKVIDQPGLINDEPYTGGRLVRFETEDEPSDLLSADEYQNFIQNG